MTAAPKNELFLITNKDDLDKFLEKIQSLASWSGLEKDKPYEKGKFFLKIELESEWFYSKEAHDDAINFVKKYNE